MGRERFVDCSDLSGWTLEDEKVHQRIVEAVGESYEVKKRERDGVWVEPMSYKAPESSNDVDGIQVVAGLICLVIISFFFLYPFWLYGGFAWLGI